MPDVIIGDRIVPTSNAFTIRNVSNLRCSWEISRIGLMSFDVPYADLPAAALPLKSQKRRSVRFTHPTAGGWGGIISNVGVRDGIATFDCESWAALLRGVVTSGLTATTISGGVQQAITSARALTGISWGNFYQPSTDEIDRYITAEVTPGAQFFSNGQDIYNAFLPAVMDRLYDEYGWRAGLRAMAWNIHPETRQFNLDMTYGRNLTSTVQLRDRVHNVSSGWSDDVDDIVNTVFLTAPYYYIWQKPIYGQHLVGNTPSKPAYCSANPSWSQTKCKKKKKTWIPAVPGNPGQWVQNATPSRYDPTQALAAATTIEVWNTASRDLNGPITAQMSLETAFESESAFRAFGQTLTAALSRDEQLVTIECADVGGVWTSFREGDIIAVDLSNSGRVGNMVVRTRALDTTRGTMTIAGEANLA